MDRSLFETSLAVMPFTVSLAFGVRAAHAEALAATTAYAAV